MEQVTIKFNKRTNAGKAIEALLKVLSGQKGVEIISSLIKFNGHLFHNFVFLQSYYKYTKNIKP
ncbi:MAG: hypothetical protein E6Q89_06985 [Bacteroidia bacterium]|nr:MAG: hypothetical protein E6Q89_06985 [Bacteroidia bacterium]